MFWIFTLLVILLRTHGLKGECYSGWRSNIYYYYVDCLSVDEEELMSFINTRDVDELNIENSFIQQVEYFPSYYQNRLNSLTIKNSRVKTFLPTQFRNLRFLDLSYNEIREMSFLKHTILYSAILRHNQIEFLNGSSLTNNIHILDLSHNDIKEYTTLKSESLEVLNLSHNSIEKMENLVKDLKKIRTIDLSFNKLKKVNPDEFDDLGFLKHLNLSHNSIQIVQYPFFSQHGNILLDISFNRLNSSDKSLENSYDSRENSAYYYFDTLNLENNYFKNLNFLTSNGSREIRGGSLIVRNNNINKLYPLNFKGVILRKLDLSLNEIETIDPSSFEGSQVTELFLDGNKITSINSSSFLGLSGLEKLNLSFNPLTTFDVSSQKNILKSIDLSHCLLKNIPRSIFEKNEVLSELNLTHNAIQIVEPLDYSRLNILNLSNNNIKNLPVNVSFNYQSTFSLDLSNNPLTSVQNVFINKNIKNLYLKGITLSLLSDKEVEGFEEFEYLDLSNTSVQEVSNNTFDRLTSLKTLILDDNLIKMIPSNFFGFNLELTTLSIVRNPISIISIDSFPHKMQLKYFNLTLNGKLLRKRFFNLISLKELNIVHSVVAEIQKHSFKGLINLVKLSFENSTVQNVEPGAFLGLSNVIHFDAQNLFANLTTLKSRTFVGLKALEILNISSIGIGVIEDDAFFGLLNLKNLTLSGNKIGNLPKNAFVGLKTLKMLDLSYNNLTGKESTFPIGIFRDLIDLTDLHLQHNRIIKIHIGEFSNLRNLRFLNLSHNQLSYLDRHLLFPLRNLEVLDINSNHVIKFDYHFTLKHLSKLRFIGIGENKWPCENMTIMLNDFEQHGVDYREINKLEFEVENIGGIYCVHVCNYLYCPTEEDLVAY